MSEQARVVELFSSVQGEAELVGYRQVFVGWETRGAEDDDENDRH